MRRNEMNTTLEPQTANIKETKDSKAESKARTPAILAILLCFCVLFSLRFWHLLFHEGGHALSALTCGTVTKVLYAHPFTFAGFSRPISCDRVIIHAGGPAIGLLVPLLVFILLWKRRSAALLPLVMVFAWAAILDGGEVRNQIPGGFGDYSQIIRLTGLPEAAIVIPGLVMFVIGILFFLCLLPLLGLGPKDWRVLLVLPIATMLWGGVSVLVAHLVGPGSPIEVIYHQDIISLAEENWQGFLSAAVLLAVIYLTLFRLIYPWLPSWLKSETVLLTWKDLRIPALSAATCVILGLILIH
jgi:hypothetical protein